MEDEPAIAVAGNIAQETGGNLATIATNTTGLATAASQTTGNTTLSTIATNTTGLATASAQTTGNASLSTIASNTTGLATASAQTTGNTSLSTIATNTTGIATAANQTTGNTSLATLAGAVTGSRFQDNLGQVGGVAIALGQTTSSASLPVVIANNQSVLPINGAVASGGTNSANPVKVSGVYNSTLPVFTNGQIGDLQITSNGSLQTNLNTLIAGEDLTNNKLVVEQRYTYASINTATTTTVKSGAGFIHTLIIAGGTAGAITVYDNTSAAAPTIIATFTPGSVSSPVALELDVSFNTGLTIVTANATVLMVGYR